MLQILLFLLPNALSLEIIERFSWGADPGSASGPDLTGITDIVIGNDGSVDCTSQESCEVWIQSLHKRDQESGLADLKYNFYISSQGLVFEGTGWNKQGSLAGRYAASSLGLAYLGSFGTGISAGAEQAIKDLVKMGYQAGTIRSEFCMMFTCDTSLQNGFLHGPPCPGGNTYGNLAQWQPLPGVSAHHVYRPCGCGALDSPTNGAVQYASYDVASVATYSCVSGFELIGQERRTCEISGAWSDVSSNPPQCVDPTRGLIIVPKAVWDEVVPGQEYIEGGFPIATFFIDVADAYCVDDADCRTKLSALKKSAWDDKQEEDVLCNFYIAKTGIIYEGRGWGVKGAYTSEIRKTQGICFLGLDAVASQRAVNTLFRLLKDAKDTKKVNYLYDYCFQTNCPNMDPDFCRAVESKWLVRSDRPDYANKYCYPTSVTEDSRAPAMTCRHKMKHDLWLNYSGRKSVSVSGCQCLDWSDQATTQHHFYPEAFPYAELDANYCRNPDMSAGGPWCITEPGCEGAGTDTCAIPQCAPAVSFTRQYALQYTLFSTRSTVTDKLTLTIKPDTPSAGLIRIEGDGNNHWEVSLVKGHVVLSLTLSHGPDETSFTLTSNTSVLIGATNEIQILRKNHKVLFRLNGEESVYTHPINRTEYALLEFRNPRSYLMGNRLPSGTTLYQGCLADLTFNKDNLLAVVTDNQPAKGDLIIEPSTGIKDTGCLAALPFEWGSLDILTTPAPTSLPVTEHHITEAAVAKKGSSLPYIIIAIVILVILLILLIGCLLFKRHNKDKGVYKVDEAVTTKWDWKKGILPVLTERKASPAVYGKVAETQDNPEVFA